VGVEVILELLVQVVQAEVLLMQQEDVQLVQELLHHRFCRWTRLLVTQLPYTAGAAGGGGASADGGASPSDNSWYMVELV
jgi:hypothetical protein